MIKTIFITLVTALACLFFMVKAPHFLLSPGKLSAGHQRDSGSCMECHTAFKGAPDGKCQVCHRPEQIGVVNAGGEKPPNPNHPMANFHIKNRTKNCSFCHIIHRQISKLPSEPVFGHENLAKALREDCQACHEKPEDNIHKISHGKCYQCHNENEWKPAIFSHEGLVNNEACGLCHERPGDKLHALISGKCMACHDSHAWRPAIFSHREALNQKECTRCHKRPDDGLHRAAGNFCGKCHLTEKWKPAEFDHSGITGKNACVNCHSKPADAIHRNSGAICSKCHSIIKWKPAKFDHDDYFRFDSHHKDNCEECHMGGNYTTYTCYGCHEHSERKILKEHRKHGMLDYQNCTECHRSGDEHEAERKWNKIRKKNSDRSLKRGTKNRRYKNTRQNHHEDDGDEENGHDDD